MKKKIEYLDNEYDSRESLIETNFFREFYNNFEEYISVRKWKLKDAKEWCEKNNKEDGYNDYLIFKEEIEDVLNRRDIIEIGIIILNGGGHSGTEIIKTTEDLEKYLVRGTIESFIQKMERIYYEFYHEDENFRPELIKTPIDELKKMQF
jgi:hypothetical protein